MEKKIVLSGVLFIVFLSSWLFPSAGIAGPPDNYTVTPNKTVGGKNKIVYQLKEIKI